MLQDLSFRWARFISGGPTEDSRALALKYMLIPCGLIRGALGAWGLDVIVNVDVSALPKAVFHVRLASVPATSAGAAAAATNPAGAKSTAGIS